MNDMLQDQRIEITELQGYEYRLWHYQASLSVLTVRAYQPSHPGHNIHIVFQTVSYVQVPVSWKDGDFRIGTPEEYKRVVEQIGLNEFKAAQMTLFVVDLPYSQIQVLCHSVFVKHDVPPLY